MIRWLSNWPDVWSSYRAGRPLPPLQFRSGLTLYHGAHDSPVALLHEVFGEKQYRRHLSSPVEGMMIDLGANVGAVALDWASRSPALRIHAYEPNPATNTTLRRNIEANGLANRIMVFDEAVGRESGVVRLWTNVNSMTATAYGENPPTPAAVATPVTLIDLNEVVRRADGGPIALLKMDTEGAEADTLEGASPATLQAISQVILEYHVGLCPEASARCRKTLEQAGFNCLIRPTNRSHGLMYAWRTEA
ncbi:MAG TPA: FkbM family methyltransferase [Pyrinomonadaceae bacterium]|nr:FkbM family methyltransferase [Pyrinomonadaceae bacterium]